MWSNQANMKLLNNVFFFEAFSWYLLGFRVKIEGFRPQFVFSLIQQYNEEYYR